MRNHVYAVAAIALSFAAPVHAGMFGLSKFKVEQSDDRFSTVGLTTYSGLNNRISSKSLAGGTHIDDKGVFVEPFAIKERANGSLVSLGFFIHNEADISTNYGSPLTLGTPLKISFLTGEGQPIVLPIERGETRYGNLPTYNTITRSASSSVSETGFADVTQEQYLRIINATSLVAKVEGDKRSMVYEAKDISKKFIPNLKGFYDSYIAK